MIQLNPGGLDSTSPALEISHPIHHPPGQEVKRTGHRRPSPCQSQHPTLKSQHWKRHKQGLSPLWSGCSGGLSLLIGNLKGCRMWLWNQASFRTDSCLALLQKRGFQLEHLCHPSPRARQSHHSLRSSHRLLLEDSSEQTQPLRWTQPGQTSPWTFKTMETL